MIFSFGILVQIILSASQKLKNKVCIDSLLYSLTSDSEVFNSLESSSYTRIQESDENLPGRIRGGLEDIDKVLKKTSLKEIAFNLEHCFSMKTDALGRIKIAKTIIWCFTNESFKAGDKIFYWSGKTREEVISQTTIVDFWEFLADTLTYCYQRENAFDENYNYKISEHINEIEKSIAVTIDTTYAKSTPLLPKNEIDKVFHLESIRSLDFADIRVSFHVLDGDDDAFDYSKLKAFISRNIKRYVFSLVKIDELHTRDFDVSQQANAEITNAILKNTGLHMVAGHAAFSGIIFLP